MASSSLSSSTTLLLDANRATCRQSPSPSQCVTLPTLPAPAPAPGPPLHSQTRTANRTTSYYCRKIARNVVAMATGEVTTAQVAATTELPEIVKTIQQTWDKIEDKYAVTSLAVAGVVGLWASTGAINAIDKLPLVPGVLELVGIGCTGLFAYKNLVFKPDREALVQKIKDTYKEILGTD